MSLSDVKSGSPLVSGRNNNSICKTTASREGEISKATGEDVADVGISDTARRGLNRSDGRRRTNGLSTLLYLYTFVFSMGLFSFVIACSFFS